jgi:hypothetical protein
MNKIDLLVDLFNKFGENTNHPLVKHNKIYRNNQSTWDFFNQTNGEDEVAIAKEESIEFNNNLPYLVVEYDAYFKSMSEEQVIEFIKQIISVV